LEPQHALLLLLPELRKRPHRLSEGFLEAERTVLRVFASDDDLAAEREVVALMRNSA
jgi:hypothetical protein